MNLDVVARRLAEATVEILIGASLFLCHLWPIRLLACVALGTGIGAIIITLISLHDD